MSLHHRRRHRHIRRILTWVALPRFPGRMKNGNNRLFNKEEVLLAIKLSACKQPITSILRIIRK